MRVLFLPLGDHKRASSRVRLYQYLEPLAQLEVRARVFRPDPLRPVPGLPFSFYKLRLLRALAGVQVIFLQKLLLPPGTLNLLKRTGIPLVYDFDDAIYTKADGHFASAASLCQARSRLHKVLQCSDVVVVGNKHLAHYAENFARRVEIIPTPVDCHCFRPLATQPDQKGRVIVGWVGTGEQHLPHLQLLRQPLEEVGKSHPVTLRLIGVMRSQRIRDCFRSANRVAVEFVDWVPPQDMPREINRFHIGVMPLRDSEWARGKCGLKALEYMACGVATVCSPVGINADIIRHGRNGFLASTLDEWTEALSRLADSAPLRLNLGRAARRTVEEQYSLEVAAPRLAELLRQVSADGKST
jgi:glycosyltransferase involved in cell wall biosynthesis